MVCLLVPKPGLHQVPKLLALPPPPSGMLVSLWACWMLLVFARRRRKRQNVELPLSPTDLSSRRLVPFPGLQGDLRPLHLLEPSRSEGAGEEQPEPNCCPCSWASQTKSPLGLHPGLGTSVYICWKGANPPGTMWVKIVLAMWFRPECVVNGAD